MMGTALQQANESRMQFIATEFDLALTFASVALSSDQYPARRWRNQLLARQAYEGALRFLDGAQLSERDAARLREQRRKVEAALDKLSA